MIYYRKTLFGRGPKLTAVQFVERLWKSIKYDEVYLHAYDSVSAAKHGLARYLAFYNQRRPHSSLDRKTPDEFYYENLPKLQNAA